MTPPDPKPPIGEQGSMVPTAATMMLPRASHGGGMELMHTEEHVPDLVWPQSVLVFGQMLRSDARLAALWHGWMRLIMRRRYELDPAGADEVDVRRIAQDLGVPIAGMDEDPPLRGRSRFEHSEHLAHALLALRDGSYWFEIVGEEIADENGKAWRLRKLGPRPPATLQSVLVADDGGLAGILQLPKNGAREPVLLDVGQVVGFVWQREAANWYGVSQLRPVHQNWLFKRIALKADAVQKRRNSLGIATFKPGSNASPDVLNAYNQIGRRLSAGEETSVTLGGSDHEFDLKGVSGTLPNALETARYHDEEYAAAFLAMWMQLGQTQTGSRALGDTFLDVFQAVLDAIAEDWYCGTMNEYVIRKWMAYNYGHDHTKAMPRLTSRRTETTELAVEDFILAVEKGVLTPGRSLEQWFREQFSVPPLEDGEGERVAPAETPVEPTGSAPDLRVVEASHDHVVHAAALDDGPTSRQRWRELTDREIHAAIDPEGMDQRWREAVSRVAAAWPSLARSQARELGRQIVEANGDLAILARLNATAVGGSVLLGEMLKIGNAAAGDAIREAGAQGVTITDATIERVRASFAARAESTTVIIAQQNALTASDIAMRLTGGSLTPAEVSAAVVKALGERSDSWIADRVQGPLTAAQNEARAAVFEQGPEPARFVATEIMDANTCDPCRDVDGKEYASLEDAEADYPDAGYRDCDGFDRCRGFIFAEYETGDA